MGTNGQPRMVGNSHLQNATAVGTLTGTTYRVVDVNNSTSPDFFALDVPYTSNGTFRVITRGDSAVHYQSRPATDRTPRGRLARAPGPPHIGRVMRRPNAAQSYASYRFHGFPPGIAVVRAHLVSEL